jgi:hypothetical protein
LYHGIVADGIPSIDRRKVDFGEIYMNILQRFGSILPKPLPRFNARGTFLPVIISGGSLFLQTGDKFLPRFINMSILGL